jgi:hypothetical protein
MLRVSLGIFAVCTLLATSPAYAGSIIPGGSGATLVGGTLFETDEARLKFALLNGGDNAGLSNPFIPVSDTVAASPLIEGDVIFTMIVAGGGPGSNVGFQYGSDGTEPKLPAGMAAPAAIPEPATLLLLASGLGFALRRRLQQKAAR